MTINFSNVNISLRQFHDVASGKYSPHAAAGNR